MTHRPAILPPPPASATLRTPPPDGCEDMPWPADGEPASGVRPVIDAATAERLRAEWAALAADDARDPLAFDPWADSYAIDREAGL